MDKVVAVPRRATALCLALLLAALPLPAAAAAGDAQAGTASTTAPRDALGELPAMKNDLQRYRYLADLLQRLNVEERIVVQQLLASCEDELGLYNEALRDFPFDNRVPLSGELPQPADWQASDAVETIAKLAADRRIVLINEAHHDAHTRELTLALLPRLRAMGFTHFAAEALGDDPDLMQRGYPVTTSGSEYLHEPLYGEIVRQAIRLGFTVVSYESESGDLTQREAGQARKLYRKVFEADPKARLFVHAGYAHIDKTPGNLGGTIQPMAMALKRLSGFDPLSIDQTHWRDIGPLPASDPYQQLLALYQPQKPTVLTRRSDGVPWSADPLRHDVDVLLPPPGHQRRPRWLALDGLRKTRLINTELCAKHIPCVIEARYAGESDDAIPADRYTFLLDDSLNTLYLYPGSYRLRAVDTDDRVLSKHSFEVTGP
jgi:hypothetical protein